LLKIRVIKQDDDYDDIINVLFIFTIYLCYIFFGTTDWLISNLVGLLQTSIAVYFMIKYGLSE